MIYGDSVQLARYIQCKLSNTQVRGDLSFTAINKLSFICYAWVLSITGNKLCGDKLLCRYDLGPRFMSTITHYRNYRTFENVWYNENLYPDDIAHYIDTILKLTSETGYSTMISFAINVCRQLGYVYDRTMFDIFKDEDVEVDDSRLIGVFKKYVVWDDKE